LSARGAHRAPVEPLLKVQQRRVDRAIAQLRDANQRILERRRGRDTARERWRRAEAARRREIAALARRSALPERQAVTAPTGEDRDAPALLALHLAQASSALEWWRARVAEESQALQSAELDLAHAQAALEDARRVYGQERARHQALLTLAQARRHEHSRTRLRSEECAIEDLLHARFTAARGGSPS
jgi:hypothetical protein